MVCGTLIDHGDPNRIFDDTDTSGVDNLPDRDFAELQVTAFILVSIVLDEMPAGVCDGVSPQRLDLARLLLLLTD